MEYPRLQNASDTEEGQRPLMRRQRAQNYKPIAIRLPILLLFAAVLAACVGLIEYAVHRAVMPAQSGYRLANGSEPLPGRVMVKRQSAGTCTALPTHTVSLTSLQSKASSLCSQFSHDFPTSTRLNAAQVTLFEQWSASFFPISSALSSEDWQISSASVDCRRRNLTNYEPFETLMKEPKRLQWGGCHSTSFSRDCYATGTVYLSSSTVHNEISAACAAVASSMASITSQRPSTVASTSVFASLTSQRPTSVASSSAFASITSQRPSTTEPEGTSATNPNAMASITSQRPTSVASTTAFASITSQRPSSVALSSAFASITSQRSTTSLITLPGSAAPSSMASITSQRMSVTSVTILSKFPSTTSASAPPTGSAPLSSYASVTSSRSPAYASTTASSSVADKGVLSITTSSLGNQIPSTTTSSTSASSTNPTSTSDGGPFATFAKSEMIVNRTFDEFSYVAAIYVPTILAVFIKIFWEIIYASFKMMEPFNQLTKSGGVSARKSLFAQYLSNSIAWTSIKAALSGATLPLLTTFTYGVVTLITVLAASSMNVRSTATCTFENGQTMRCDNAWIIDLVFTRLVEALLVICFVVILAVIVFTRRYRTGVACNPSSIASVATLVNHDGLIHEFRLVPAMATESELTAALVHRRCQIKYHGHEKGDQRYGICGTITSGVNGTPQLGQPNRALQRWIGGGYSAVANPVGARTSGSVFSKRVEDNLLDGLQILSAVVLFAIVTAYRFDYHADPFNNFFNSGTLQARLAIIFVAAIVDIQWKRLDREVRITEPYRRMAQGFARPETTVLQNLNGTCWSWLMSSLDQAVKFPALWFQTLVSFVAVLSDFNIIAVATVIWRDGQTIPQFVVSCYLAMTITLLMTIVMLITMLWWRRTIVSQMPRCPETIGAVFSYLCASRFAVKMGEANLEEVSQEERDDMVIATGWRFSFRYRTGIDGQERWMVDFESPETDEKMPVVQQEWRAFDFNTPIPAEQMPVVQQEWRR